MDRRPLKRQSERYQIEKNLVGMSKVAQKPTAKNSGGQPEELAQPGINPAQQNRSRANFAALIRAGREELNEKSLSQVRIEDLVHRAGTSVGAFYNRFTNKEAFFSAIQTITVNEVFEVLETEITRIAEIEGDESMLEELAGVWVHAYRNHKPIYIASARHVALNRNAWDPFRKLGQAATALVVENIGPRLRSSGVQEADRLVQEALQIVNGTLLNSVLNNPGPVSIGDPKMVVNVSKILKCFLANDECGGPDVKT
jgi:AcrR family transcriptional regulator